MDDLFKEIEEAKLHAIHIHMLPCEKKGAGKPNVKRVKGWAVNSVGKEFSVPPILSVLRPRTIL